MNGFASATLDFFLRRETILVAFVISAVLSAVLDGVLAQTGSAWGIGILSVLVFGALAWFTHKQQLIATWATILVLILNGSGYLYDSFNNLTGGTGESLAIDLLKVAAGIYLTWGALIIHRERHVRD